MSGPRDLPNDRDVADLYGLKPDFTEQKAPNPVDWWAIAAAGASNVVIACDFATGWAERVIVPSSGAVRLFPQGMAVREPMVLNTSANNIALGFRPDITYPATFSQNVAVAFVVAPGIMWTKYGLSIMPDFIAGGLTGIVRVRDGTTATLASLVGSATGDASGPGNMFDTWSRLQGYNGASWDRLRVGLGFGSSAGTTGILTSGLLLYDGTNTRVMQSASNVGDAATGSFHTSVSLMGYNSASFDRLRTVTAIADAFGGTGVLGVHSLGYNGATYDRLQSRGDADAIGTIGQGQQVIQSRLYGYNGATWDRLRAVGGDNADSAANAGGTGLLVVDTRGKLYNAGQNNWDRARSLHSFRGTSGLNASQQIVLNMGNLHDTLAIISVTSAGTATLVVEVSVDNSNWVTVDSLAAAASQIKQYTATTLGATTAVSPLTFPFVRVTAGAAGAGNTTTLTVAAK